MKARASPLDRIGLDTPVAMAMSIEPENSFRFRMFRAGGLPVEGCLRHRIAEF